jgi:formylglycine-generating enzyme required for sulfatase activity
MRSTTLFCTIVSLAAITALAACQGRSRSDAPDRARAAAPPPEANTNAAADAPVHAGPEFDDCKGAAWCPRMIEIPAGAYTMGVPATEPGFFEIEGPQHRVTVGKFAVGKFDVTRGQWAAFASATRRKTQQGCSWSGRTRMAVDPKGAWNSLGFMQDDTHPVVCVTWSDAKDYVHWLSERTGHTYRLLTEAEWEYAARAGTTTAYAWGAQPSHEHANYGADSCCSGRALGKDRWVYSSPVGSFPPNAFGLYDMNGNVLQWVEDCFAISYTGLPADGSPNEKNEMLRTTGDLAFMNGKPSCSFRMLRGGDYGDPPALFRSGFRSWAPPDDTSLDIYRSGGVGFRVATIAR